MHGVIAGASPKNTRRGPTLPGERRRRRYNKAMLRRGLDDHGRFIGYGDVDRGWQHFWNAQHRRAQAPMQRDFRDELAKKEAA